MGIGFGGCITVLAAFESLEDAERDDEPLPFPIADREETKS